MRPLTDNCPKPLLSVAGIPLIEYHLQKLKAAGVAHIVINCAYLANRLFQYFEQRPNDGLMIELVDEGDEPLETAGGIVNVLDKIGSMPFLVINGDVWCDLDYRLLVERAYSLVDEACCGELFLVENPSHNLDGDFSVCSKTGTLLMCNPHMRRFTYSGLSIFKPALFQTLSNQSGGLGPFLRKWAEEGVLSARVFSGYWLDVGTPERLVELELRVSTLIETGHEAGG
jgi:MurNAc alpha-1-phosphate uridylyltransferase